jgi:hypothetical protein
MPNEFCRRAGSIARRSARVATMCSAFSALALVGFRATVEGQALPTRPTPPGCEERSSWIDRSVADFATRLAISRAGLGGRGVAGDVAARARATAWLPHVSARVGRGLSATASSSGGVLATDRAAESEAMSFEVRLVFALDRAFFSPVELDAERIETQRFERRRSIERDVLDALVILEQQRLATCTSAGTIVADSAVTLRARAQLESAIGLSLAELRRRAGR